MMRYVWHVTYYTLHVMRCICYVFIITFLLVMCYVIYVECYMLRTTDYILHLTCYVLHINIKLHIAYYVLYNTYNIFHVI